MSLVLWQRMKDLNPHKRSQSPVCYHYTNPLNAYAIITILKRLSSRSRIFSEECFHESSLLFCLTTHWQIYDIM